MKAVIEQKWFRWGIVNLCVVALFGSLMRYKIAYDFPFFEQKNLLHAHSHFAFSGWITHMLFSGLTLILAKYIGEAQQKKYHWLIALNLLSSFGMLFSFTVQGYKTVSIIFSTLTLFISFAYAWFFIKDSRAMPAKHPSRPWAIMGLLLSALSSLGPFFLAYMMASKSINSHYYLGSVYYYLHFQYSGWFFFGSMALVAAHLPLGAPSLQKYFKVFAFTAIPTFFLSILWAKLPMWLYGITVAATLIQLYMWMALLIKFWPVFRQHKSSGYPAWVNLFFIAAAFSLSIKFLLQAISVIPSLSQLVFGIRPIVIAYLHLVLLGVYSLFLIGYALSKGYLKATAMARMFAFGFLLGVVLNEAFLGIQGFTAFAYIPVPHINGMLLGAALVLLSCAIGLALSQRKSG